MIVGGIDNGVSGTIGVLGSDNPILIQTPVFKQSNYTKKKSFITRIDSVKLMQILSGLNSESFFYIERPMVNPNRFQATISAIRALEATQTVLELLKIPFEFVDSKKWQKGMLQKGLKGSEELKLGSKDVGKRLFPEFSELIEKHGDADGLLIAEYYRRLRHV